MDHDRWPSSVAASDQEHGVPEVFQHGAVAVHTLCSSRSSHCWSRCSRSSKAKVSDVSMPVSEFSVGGTAETRQCCCILIGLCLCLSFTGGAVVSALYCHVEVLGSIPGHSKIYMENCISAALSVHLAVVSRFTWSKVRRQGIDLPSSPVNTGLWNGRSLM